MFLFLIFLIFYALFQNDIEPDQNLTILHCNLSLGISESFLIFIIVYFSIYRLLS